MGLAPDLLPHTTARQRIAPTIPGFVHRPVNVCSCSEGRRGRWLGVGHGPVVICVVVSLLLCVICVVISLLSYAVVLCVIVIIVVNGRLRIVVFYGVYLLFCCCCITYAWINQRPIGRLSRASVPSLSWSLTPTPSLLPPLLVPLLSPPLSRPVPSLAMVAVTANADVAISISIAAITIAYTDVKAVSVPSLSTAGDRMTIFSNHIILSLSSDLVGREAGRELRVHSLTTADRPVIHQPAMPKHCRQPLAGAEEYLLLR